MTWLPSLFAVIAGVSNPLQSGSNSEFLKSTGAPVVARFIVYLIAGICLLATAPFLGLPVRETVRKLHLLAWWVFIGGLCNAVFLMSTLLATRRLGSATFTTLVVIAAVITSLVLDNYGLMGFAVRAATMGRLVGALWRSPA